MPIDKKHVQLGVSYGTAGHRLRMDIMFSLAVRCGYMCFQCGGDLTRGTFSIEHKEPWLDSSDPIGKFFDLGNIGFSHRSCNYKAARRTMKVYFSKQEKNAAQVASWRRRYLNTALEKRQKMRRLKYEKHGI